MNKLSTARARLLINQPFFGALIMKTPLVAMPNDPRVPTAATDMRKIYYNPAFFDQLTVDEVAFVLAHEVMHIALLHGFRKRSRVHKPWNHAADYVINWALKVAGFKLWDKCLIDKKFATWFSEQVYDYLMDNPDEGGGEGDGDGDGTKGGGLGSSDVLSPGELDGSTMSSAEQAIAEVQIKQNVAQAAQMARMAGKMPGDLDKMITEFLKPRVPWRDALRDQMTRRSKDDMSWKRRNKRFRDVYLPSADGQAMGEIVVIVDTSMSMFDEIDQAASEIQDIATTMKPSLIRVIWADTRVAGEQTFAVGEELTLRAAGGGGTDMRVPLEHAEQYDPEIVVLLTDGYTPWPNVEPPYPLIVACSTPVDVPIGYVIRVE